MWSVALFARRAARIPRLHKERQTRSALPRWSGTFAALRESNFAYRIKEVDMASTWIVAANAGRARIFSEAQAGAPLEEINDMVNTAARLRTVETETDQLGQRSASKSRHNVGAATQPSGYEPNQSPAEHQTELFARNVAAFLLQSYQEGRFRQIVLIASPEFLGMLRKVLDQKVHAVVSAEINKDYTHFNAKELRGHVDAQEAKG
jgi:protein required for attachment to host cells